MAAPTYPACGMVLKKIEAAGDMTATEMTMAWRRPSVPDLRVVEGAATAGEEEAVSLIKALLTVNVFHIALACSVIACSAAFQAANRWPMQSLPLLATRCGSAALSRQGRRRYKQWC